MRRIGEGARFGSRARVNDGDGEKILFGKPIVGPRLSEGEVELLARAARVIFAMLFEARLEEGAIVEDFGAFDAIQFAAFARLHARVVAVDGAAAEHDGEHVVVLHVEKEAALHRVQDVHHVPGGVDRIREVDLGAFRFAEQLAEVVRSDVRLDALGVVADATAFRIRDAMTCHLFRLVEDDDFHFVRVCADENETPIGRPIGNAICSRDLTCHRLRAVRIAKGVDDSRYDLQFLCARGERKR